METIDNGWRDALLFRVNNAKQRLFSRDSMIHNANTPYHILYDDGLAKLRYYPALEGYPTRYQTPLLIIMPLAVGPKIFDLLESRSFIRFMLERGFHVYLIDWGSPSRAHANHGLGYYVSTVIPDAIRTTREYSGSQDISLHGWSMGGIFTALYAAHSKDKYIKNMFLVGAPIDTHASGFVGKLIGTLDDLTQFIEQKTRFHPRHLPEQLIHTHGWMNRMLFKAIDPIGIVKSYWHLFHSLSDTSSLSESAAKADFINTMFDYPGAIIKDIGMKYMLMNSIINGTCTLHGTPINLKHITANLFVIAGKTDTLATADAVQPILNMVSSPDKHYIKIPGGHVGIIASRITCERVWPMMADWLAARSEPVICQKDTVHSSKKIA